MAVALMDLVKIKKYQPAHEYTVCSVPTCLRLSLLNVSENDSISRCHVVKTHICISLLLGCLDHARFRVRGATTNWVTEGLTATSQLRFSPHQDAQVLRKQGWVCLDLLIDRSNARRTLVLGIISVTYFWTGLLYSTLFYKS